MTSLLYWIEVLFNGCNVPTLPWLLIGTLSHNSNETGKADKSVRYAGPEVIKLFSSSAQLSMKFQLLINAEIVKISGKFRFISHKLVIYPAHKC